MKGYLIIFLILPFAAAGQKVGLVFSGGAAKGIAHIGVLKALEENEIPVDYIVGTSMGGIIGGCYAAGMSPEQIENLVLSADFQRWVKGDPETGFNYQYHQNDVSPSFVNLDLSLDSTLNFQFNTSIAKDFALNFALAEYLAQATAIATGNFDSLFVPFRAVAADIFTQNEVILSKGQLSDALRATQTVPFFYNPIRVDGKYLFDGGVYNNLPADVAQHEFAPDVIIGVNVSSKIFDTYPYSDDDQLISKSLLFLLLDKSDPKDIPENGVYIQPDVKGFTSFDFAKARSLIDSGYVQTMRQMAEIKNKIARRVPCEDVAEKRNQFTNKSHPFLFGPTEFRGFNSKQKIYLKRYFKPKHVYQHSTYFSDLKKEYFQLTADNYFSNAYPNIVYDELDKKFHLVLTRGPKKNFQVDVGGVLASRDISNIHLGVNFYHFGKTLRHAYASVQTGNFYKAALIKTRIDYPIRIYLEPRVSYQSRDYLAVDDLLNEVAVPATPTVLSRINRTVGIAFGVPVKQFFKFTIDAEAFSNRDQYMNGDLFISTDTLDVLKLSGFKTSFGFSANSLNRKQYANAGKSVDLAVEYFHANEELTPGNTSVIDGAQSQVHQWFRLRLKSEAYFGRRKFKQGYLVQGVLSNQESFFNYFGTIINAPAFNPLQDSPSLILENYRAFNYVAAGWRAVYNFTNKLELRGDAYVYKPFETISQNTSQRAVEEESFKIFMVASGGLVYHSIIGPVSISVNYYNDKQNELGVLLHLGFLLYNPHSLE